MIMFGKNIQSATDQLRKVNEDYLFHSLTNPKPQMASAIQQLRIVYSLNTRGYSELKRQLPYIVCGAFNPPFRRLENFAFTESFILDFDHLAAKKLNIDETREKISKDSRVLMCFASPSLDGLKVMFRLKKRCYDKGIYSLFYKAFADAFARQTGLDQVVDSKTSDVTRACFVSVDPMAYYNTNADTVDLEAYINDNNPLASFDLKREQMESEKHKKTASSTESPDPSTDIFDKIREKLRPQAAPPVKRDIFVPKQLDDIIMALKEYIEDKGIIVPEVINIQYGKKIRATLGLRQAEVNLFYGKRGYSVVESPRRGTDDGFNSLLADILRSFLADQSNLPY